MCIAYVLMLLLQAQVRGCMSAHPGLPHLRTKLVMHENVS